MNSEECAAPFVICLAPFFLAASVLGVYRRSLSGQYLLIVRFGPCDFVGAYVLCNVCLTSALGVYRRSLSDQDLLMVLYGSLGKFGLPCIFFLVAASASR